MARLGLPIFVAACALAFSPAGAISIENYQKYRLDSRTVKATPKSLLEVRMEGVLHGLLMANRRARSMQMRPLFCAPDDIKVPGSEVVEMVERELKAPSQNGGKPYSPDTAVEEVLLVAAQRRWPCSGQ
jgi:hypothetical protein